MWKLFRPAMDSSIAFIHPSMIPFTESKSPLMASSFRRSLSVLAQCHPRAQLAAGSEAAAVHSAGPFSPKELPFAPPSWLLLE